eukprot:357901-Chlamydomonas_euryale.AAC.2
MLRRATAWPVNAPRAAVGRLQLGVPAAACGIAQQSAGCRRYMFANPAAVHAHTPTHASMHARAAPRA